MLKQRYEKPEWAAAHMAEYAALAEDLTDGLAELKKAGMDVDHCDVHTRRPGELVSGAQSGGDRLHPPRSREIGGGALLCRPTRFPFISGYCCSMRRN